ncbi:hypothetical protein K466DRAFT_606902 [Polyporus arcularius HHB13444]|uniref:Uncharacterized protein n=1 Tax=Polyporus arcularius HHB13444 TaxID=1314778 RepID=A0A5C3NPK6_9APHY|nr:hypothetical protein K466DRAFT_606902 [Polyporus arcularius HHB13444]
MIDDGFRVEVPDTNVANGGDTSNRMNMDPIETPPEPPGRRRRRFMPSWKVRNMLPGPSNLRTEGGSDDNPSGDIASRLMEELDSRVRAAEDSASAVDHAASLSASADHTGAVANPEDPAPQPTLFTRTVRTTANKFGLWRRYTHRPTAVAEEPSLEERFEPRASANASKSSTRTISDIIRPFPNLSAWRWSHWFWSRSSSSKTKDDRRALQELVCGPGFEPRDIEGLDFNALEAELDKTALPWQDPHGGWRETKLTIGIPTGVKPTQADRRTAAAAAREAARDIGVPDGAPSIDVPGIHFDIPGFHYRSIPSVMRSVIEHDHAARDFVWEPYEEYVQLPGNSDAMEERAYSEMWTTDAFITAHRELQDSPTEPGCTLPRVIAGLILSSDGTHVAQFGSASMWPDYLAFANQSKYTRVRPEAHAIHHLAYIPKLPDSVREAIRKIRPKGAVAPLLTHLRRELFHAAWGVILEDDEFLHAYEHGMVLRCSDGVVRRVYPRIFVYSADYPEKVLIATIRDMGRCPCPRCLVTKDRLGAVGSTSDRQARTDSARHDNEERQQRVSEARTRIYNDGYVVNSDVVENLLKDDSLVPTENAFSKIKGLNSHRSFDFHEILVVDLMHEFELGVWKAVFAHLVRILEAQDPILVDKMNERYRQVPIFGRSTIRRFTSDVSEMRKMAARDFEDMLQCSIPCFENLLPSPYNEQVLDLLYVLASWHAAAKLRMHTDSSLKVLDSWTTSLGRHLRHFQRVVCEAFNTHETRREREARQRAEARRNTSTGGSASQAGDRQPRPRKFNLTRYKLHALGDYVTSITRFGTTDGYSTQPTELEHRRLKARYRRTNKNKATGQIVNIGIREAEMRRMGQELHEIGVHVPGNKPQPAPDADNTPAEVHVHIAKEQHHANAVYIDQLLHENRNDPAFEVCPALPFPMIQ